MTSQRIHTNSTLKRWRNDVISQRKFLTAALCSTDTRVAKTAKTVTGKRGSRKVEGEHVRKPTHIHTVREYMYVSMNMIHMSRNTSFNWRLCHMPYASNKNKSWYNPKNTCGKHYFIQARSRQQGWIWLNALFTKEQTKRKRMQFCTHTTLLGSTHSLDEELRSKGAQTSCFELLNPHYKSETQTLNNCHKMSQVSSQSVGGPRGI